MFPCIACHFPISLCQILHLATINVIIVTKVAGGNPIEFLLPEPSGTALFIFIQKQPLCRPSSQTVGVDLCIERFHHRHRGTAGFFTYPRSGCSGFSEPDAWPEACGTRSESALYLRAGFLPLFPPFFQNKKPARNDFTVSSLSEHSRIALQGLKTLAAAMERIVPHLPMYKSMRKGISHSCWQTCCHRCLCKCVKTQMTWNWSKDCFSIWMPTIPKNCPWKVSRKNSVSAALSCPGSSLRNSTPLFLIT